MDCSILLLQRFYRLINSLCCADGDRRIERLELSQCEVLVSKLQDSRYKEDGKRAYVATIDGERRKIVFPGSDRGILVLY